GPAADVYALGAILYECLTGRPPFLAADADDIRAEIRTQEPVLPRLLVQKVPPVLEQICLACLVKNPRRRYADPLALDLALRGCLEVRPIVGGKAGRVVRAAKWVGTHVAIVGLLIALAAALIAGTVISSSFALWAAQASQLARAEADAARAEADAVVGE